MKNKKIWYLLIPSTILFLIGIFFLTRWITAPSPQAKIHYHAGFVVFENGKKLDFSDSKYMYIEPCTTAVEKNLSSGQIQAEKAHLHDNVGDLIHIEQAGAIWKDLFTNMGVTIDYASTTGFINGKSITNWDLQSIHPFDSLVVFIGKNDPSLLEQAVTKDYMITQASKSSTCGG